MTSAYMCTTMNNRMIIRVDANKRIALGHLKRCLALGEALRDEGQESMFVCAEDDEARTILERSGFEFKLVSEETNTKDDAVRAMELARSLGVKAILLDSYNVDDAYVSFFEDQGIAVIYIDDFAKADIPCSVILNGTPGSERIPYAAPMKLLGKDYIILAKEYWKPPHAHIGRVENILITMGSVDHYDLSTRVLRFLEKQEQDFSVSVVAGPYYENRAQIETQRKGMSKEVEIFFNPDSLIRLMGKCSMAISAGGFTLYELATMGKPTLGISLWENQNGNVRSLGDRQIIEPLFYSDDTSFDVKLEQAVCALLGDEKKRCELSTNGQRHFDGQGAIRTAQRIAKFVRRDHEQEKTRGV